MPDGRSVILSLNAGSGTHLWRQRFPGGEPEQITFSPSEEAGVAIAPDGKSVITSAGRGHETVWIHDGTGDHMVVSEGAPEELEFSPDGSRLFFLDNNRGGRGNAGAGAFTEGALRAYDLQQRRVDTLLGGIGIGSFSISPDGESVAYTVFKGREPHLWIAPLDGSRPPRQAVAEPAQFPHFGRDGHLYFAKMTAGALSPWRVTPDGGSAQRDGDFAGLTMAASPDGNWRAEMRLDARTSQFRMYLRHVSDARSIEVACGLCLMNWPDEHHFAIRTAASMGSAARTYVFATSGQNSVPDGIEQMKNLEAFAAERGARVLTKTAILSPVGDTYAYLEHAAQRNLYRIPLR
jgi:hypothetical protein